MDIRILGPVELKDEDRTVPLGGQLRVLLAALVLAAGRVVPNVRLIELLWAEAPPEGAAQTLRSYVRRLRTALQPALTAADSPILVKVGRQEGAGYMLRVESDQVDAVRFERLVGDGLQALSVGDPASAAQRQREALSLWRGPALADVSGRPFVIAEVSRLEGLYQAALRARLEADLALGRHIQLMGELEGLVAAEPADDRLRGLLALALYRSGRVEGAARACQEGLERLAESGLYSTELQELQRNILRCSPELRWEPPAKTRSIGP